MCYGFLNVRESLTTEQRPLRPDQSGDGPSNALQLPLCEDVATGITHMSLVGRRLGFSRLLDERPRYPRVGSRAQRRIWPWTLRRVRSRSVRSCRVRRALRASRAGAVVSDLIVCVPVHLPVEEPPTSHRHPLDASR